MGENIIFQNPVSPQPQQPVTPITPANTAAGTTPPNSSVSPPPPSIPPVSGGFPSIHFSKTLVVGVLLLIVVIIGLLIYATFVLRKQIEGKVTITYWGLWEDANIMNTAISDFERQNPNITITYVKQDPNQYANRILGRIQNNLGPDVFRFHNSWVPMLQSVLLPLPSSVITKDDFQKTFYPVVSNDLIVNGAIYGIPLEIDTLSLFVNDDILKAGGVDVPTTWDQVNAIAPKLTVKDDSGKIKTAGIALGTYDNITHAPDIISLLFLQNSVNLKDLNATAMNATGALSFYASFANNPQTNVWDQSLDPSIRVFAQGNLAMYFGYSWDVMTIKAINPNIRFSVHPVPHLLQNKSLTVASYWVEGVSSKSKHQKEALQFLKFLAQKDTAQNLYTQESKTRLFGEPYARIDLADSLKDNQYLTPFISQAKDSLSSFFAGETGGDDSSATTQNVANINQQMDAYLGNAIRSMVNGASADSALDPLTSGVNQILTQYGQK